MVQDHDYVLGLWSDSRDVDGPRERKRVLTQLGALWMWAHWPVGFSGGGAGWSESSELGGGESLKRTGP